jgi:hypothetical protein
MSETTEPEPPTSDAQPEPVRNRGRLAPAVIAVIAVVALGLSVWAVLRPYLENFASDDERAEAKEEVCTAFDVVRRGVQLNTNLQPPGGPQDVTGSLTVAANSRVALYDGGWYLLDALDRRHPATPDDLADPVRTFADNLIDIGAAATAGALNTEPEQAARLRDAYQANATIAEKCK